jgi:hypothetical protein
MVLEAVYGEDFYVMKDHSWNVRVRPPDVPLDRIGSQLTYV